MEDLFGLDVLTCPGCSGRNRRLRLFKARVKPRIVASKPAYATRASALIDNSARERLFASFACRFYNTNLMIRPAPRSVK